MAAEHGDGAAPLVVETPLPVNQVGSYFVARLSCKAIHPQPGYLILEPARDRLTLTAECGCHVYVQLSPWLVDLARALAEGHQDGMCPVPAEPAESDSPPQGAAVQAALH